VETLLIMTTDYWKVRYQQYWDKASAKEEIIKQLIEGECGCECEYCGLGAGSATFLSGSAKSRGFTKGGSDLHIVDTPIYLEVTGPNVPSVQIDAGLWIRPDKIEYAIKYPDKDCWVVHVLERNKIIRVIHLNDAFLKKYQAKHFKIVTPWIRRTQERYCEIPANSPFVQIFEALLSTIKSN
jgi:hypothetical protein